MPHTPQVTSTETCPHFPFPRQDVPAAGETFPPGHDPLSLAPQYAALGPVTLVRMPSETAYLITGHRDVREILQNEDVFRREGADGIDHYPHTAPTIASKDGEAQRRIRNLAGNTFAPARIAQMRPAVERLASGLVHRMLQDGRVGEVCDDLTMPLTLGVIGEVMGIPEGDRHRFAEWGDRFLSTNPDPEIRAADNRGAVAAMIGYMGQRLTERLAMDQAARPDDLLTAIAVNGAELIAANPDEADNLWGEIALFAASVIIAGWETTAGALACALFRLLTADGDDGRLLYRQLVDHPDRIGVAVEEMLRTIPVSMFDTGPPRRTIAPVEISGVHIPAGSLILPGNDLASRDPAVFPDPDTIDFRRTNAHRHLAFGAGPHYCLGAPLARLELQVALQTLVCQAPELVLAERADQVAFSAATTIRRPKALLVRREPSWPLDRTGESLGTARQRLGAADVAEP